MLFLFLFFIPLISSNHHFHCQFERNPYRIKLKENELFENFLQIKTIFSNCSSNYYLFSSTNTKKNLEYFSLNSTTGYLSLLQTLDYESITTWKLVIQTFDIYHIPFYTYVIIDVDDINDCQPVLSWNFPLQTIQFLNDTDPFHIQISIYESKVEQNNIIIANLIASDLDSPSKFHLKINSSQRLPFTIVGPYGDSTYVLLTNSKLDREFRDFYELNLILHDSGKPRLTSYYKLQINLLDNNDNSPKFDQDIYHVDIQENNFLNTTLLQVYAHDFDLHDNSRITYELIDDNDEKMNSIWIDHQTGIIRTKISFNYEEFQIFSFNIIAFDHPQTEQQLNSTAQVIVHILDQNDNIPKFPYSTYEFSIYENNPSHTYIGQVIAIDEDNSSLTYTFDSPSSEISTHFSISSFDGKIYAHQIFDRETIDHYIFYLIAFDGYYQSLRIEIHIKILDLNDEKAFFIYPNENNDTLIFERNYFQEKNQFLCQIEISDKDSNLNHTLLLINYLNQLKTYDYLKQIIEFDSKNFFLDKQRRLFLNTSILNQGVYYIAFKIIDGNEYFDEILLKLIIVDDYQDVPKILRQYDYLGLYLNNRFAYLKNFNSKIRSSFDQSNKYLLIILFTILIIILLSIICLFISLIRRRILKKQTNSISISNNNKNLHVRNCYDYKNLRISTSIINDNCCLLETDNKIASTWILPARSNRCDSSTIFQTLNRHSNDVYSSKRQQTPIDYTIATVLSPSNICSETPVSSDDGFCGSSDTSDPSHYLTSYRQPYLVMKDQIINRNIHSSTNSLTNGRVRFNLLNHQRDQTFEQIYISKNHSTIV